MLEQMFSLFLKRLATLDLEEKILNAMSLLVLIGVFFPWLSGEWLGGNTINYSGFGFLTSFIGIIIFLIHLFVLLVTVVPLLGGPVLLRRRYKEVVRMYLTSVASILIVACLSVLIKVTFEFSRMEVRYGILLSLIASLVATLYAFLRFQEQRKSEVQELFHHPEDRSSPVERNEVSNPLPPPPPPPPPPVEEHRLYP